MMRLLFCLFADDIGLLPGRMFHQMLETSRGKPESFNKKLKLLFAAMAKGGIFGVHDVPWFNGGLFRDDEIIELSYSDLQILHASATLNWSVVEPAIFGTLFERNFDPTKHNLVGAHYTGKADILLIVEPVLIEPRNKRWQAVKTEAEALIKAATGAAYAKNREKARDLIAAWLDELAAVRVLDPACGSGNFLYLALKRMLDVWKEAYVFCAEEGLPFLGMRHVSPLQLYGIEKNLYAHELASVVVWIGYLQWQKESGMGEDKQPILDPLTNIQHRDAILDYDATGKPFEPEWPEAEYIIGNPPFLGGNKIRQELGDKYVDELFVLYSERVPAFADLVCYWFEKARAQIETGKCQRAGLLPPKLSVEASTASCSNRSRRPVTYSWHGPIATGYLTVQTSTFQWSRLMTATKRPKILDGKSVQQINPDLTSVSDATTAFRLKENEGLWAYGSQQKGSFDISAEVARRLLSAVSPFGKNYSDVVRPSLNALQLLRRTSESWVIDFGEQQDPRTEAALYEAPFEYLKGTVFVERQNRRENRQRDLWWLHARPSPKYRRMLRTLKRYIATPALAKHRVYVWLDNLVPIDHAMIAFAREDDYFLGVLHSRIHELWALRMGTALEDRPRYTPSSTFDAFPFPWPPGTSRKTIPTCKPSPPPPRTSREARRLAQSTGGIPTGPHQAHPHQPLQRTTAWLDDAHRKLDEAVFAAYGWPSNLSDSEILERLLALNHQRAAKHAPVATA